MDGTIITTLHILHDSSWNGYLKLIQHCNKITDKLNEDYGLHLNHYFEHGSPLKSIILQH